MPSLPYLGLAESVFIAEKTAKSKVMRMKDEILSPRTGVKDGNSAFELATADNQKYVLNFKSPDEKQIWYKEIKDLIHRLRPKGGIMAQYEFPMRLQTFMIVPLSIWSTPVRAAGSREIAKARCTVCRILFSQLPMHNWYAFTPACKCPSLLLILPFCSDCDRRFIHKGW